MEGFWCDGPAAFGHRRLSIIDLDSGAQPMEDATGRYCITFNGEIYNYRELRNELEAKGFAFRTKSDTEVILNAYASWGTGCLQRFNGIFAFGLWDAVERVLLLARDHLGVKPLLYAITRNRLMFASDLAALENAEGVDNRIDQAALSDYLSLGYVLSPKTILRGVRKLEPGSFLKYEHGRPSIAHYWDLAAVANEPTRTFRSDDLAGEAAFETIGRAVTAQMVSDVPVGAFLSGGLDSSTVLFFMTKSRSQATQTFSLGFSEPSFDESEYARFTAAHLGTTHYEEHVPDDPVSAIPPNCQSERRTVCGYIRYPNLLLEPPCPAHC